jgi:hypothetical protein
MAGREVTRIELDQRMSQSLVSLRSAVSQLENINEFLATIPVGADGTDPLTISTDLPDPMDPNSAIGRFGYTEEEAQLIRQVFGALLALRTQLAPVLKQSRRLTGLE